MRMNKAWNENMNKQIRMNKAWNENMNKQIRMNKACPKVVYTYYKADNNE